MFSFICEPFHRHFQNPHHSGSFRFLPNCTYGASAATRRAAPPMAFVKPLRPTATAARVFTTGPALPGGVCYLDLHRARATGYDRFAVQLPLRWKSCLRLSPSLPTVRFSAKNLHLFFCIPCHGDIGALLIVEFGQDLRRRKIRKLFECECKSVYVMCLCVVCVVIKICT